MSMENNIAKLAHARGVDTFASKRDLSGLRVVVRASLNVPVEDGVVRNMFRIERSLPTLRFLSEKGARVVVLAHIGRDSDESLLGVYEALRAYIPLSFAPTLAHASTLAQNLKDGECLLVENVRKEEGETKDDDALASAFASLGEVFVLDAFAAAHRRHASVCGVARHLPTYAGFQLLEEIDELSSARTPEHPSLLILGGAKFETKRPLIERALLNYDAVFVGGALANDFFKAKGYSVGKSLVSKDLSGITPLLDNPRVLLPVDVRVKADDGVSRVCLPQEVRENESILDAGPETSQMLAPYIEKSAFVLWNGPLGNYEEGFSEETEEVARMIAESPARSIVGGGDTVASISKLALENDFSFISTGGGAMLSFLAEGTLPGIDALVNSKEM